MAVLILVHSLHVLLLSYQQISITLHSHALIYVAANTGGYTVILSTPQICVFHYYCTRKAFLPGGASNMIFSLNPNAAKLH